METPPSNPVALLVPVDDMFGVRIYSTLTAEHYQRLAEGMNARGSQFRSGTEARKALNRLLEGSTYLHPAHKHWVDALIYALRLTCDLQSNLRASDRAKAALEKALKAWGKTPDPDKGGFILQTGEFLDMSLGGPRRCVEHFHVKDFFNPPCSHPEALEGWKDIGLIRWISEAKGISMRLQPTPAQFQAIQRLTDYRPDKSFHVDVYDYRYKQSARSYPPGISASKIIVDITQFYDRGTMGAMSKAMELHCDYGVTTVTPVNVMPIF